MRRKTHRRRKTTRRRGRARNMTHSRRKTTRRRRARNSPLRKRYGPKYFTRKGFVRKYAKKFGGKGKASSKWGRLKGAAKHAKTRVRVMNKGRKRRRTRRKAFRRR